MAFLKLPSSWSPSLTTLPGKCAIHRSLHFPQCLWNHSARCLHWTKPCSSTCWWSNSFLLPNYPLVFENNFSPMPSPSENVSYTTKQFRGALYLLPRVTHSFSLTSTYRFSPKLLSHLPNLPFLSPGEGEASQPWPEKNEYWRLGSRL